MMAMTIGSDLRGCLLPRLLALAATVLITLSGVLGEVVVSHQCYWCGPLTELVHRRARAQPCGTAPRVLTCAPPYTYCAIIAASPPYSESRICVKAYQDMCYPLFCNTTRVWKMVCPCKGDLCNGNKTQRETKAFEELTQLAEDTFGARDKRDTDDTHDNQSKNKTRSNCNQEDTINDREVPGRNTQPGTEVHKVMSMRPQSDQPAKDSTEGRIVNEYVAVAQGRNITAAAVHHEQPGERLQQPEQSTATVAATTTTVEDTVTTPRTQNNSKPHTTPARNSAQIFIINSVNIVILGAALFIA